MFVAALRFAEKRPVVFAAVCSIGDRAEREVRVRIRLMDFIVDAIVGVVCPGWGGGLVHGFSCLEVGVVFGVRGGGLDGRDSSVRRIGFLDGV